MNILFIITGLGMGGAETQVCNLADKTSALGHDVTIVYLCGDAVVKPDNKNIECIGLGLSPSLFSLIKTFYNLVGIINRIKPDVVHSHMVHANLLVRIARLFSTIPVLISTAHNSNEGGWLRMKLYRFTHKLADLTTNVGFTSVERFESVGAVPKGEMLSIVNGIDTHRFNGNNTSDIRDELKLSSDTKLLLVIGRNQEQKDYPNLINAISALKTDKKYHIAIVGIDTEKLLPELECRGLTFKVSILGLRKDVYKLLSSADALVMSSAWEGLPIVIGEAMASECNIITTDAGGCREWLTSNEQPVPIRDAKALAKAIEEKLEKSNSEWRDIGELNRQHVVENFSIDRIVDQWLEYYKHPHSAFEND